MSAKMNKNLVLQFCRSSTGILSGPDVLEKWRTVTTLLIILRVTEISCSLICHTLRDLVSIALIKKREKHPWPWRSNTFSKTVG